MRLRWQQYWISTLLLAAAPFQVSRAESPPTDPLQMFVFGAYRAEEEHPFSFTELGPESIKGQVYGQEPGAVLSRTPGFTFYSDSGSGQGYTYLRLRGIDQTRINSTLDGVPLNEPEDQGAYFSNYYDFLSSVRSVQLIRGVGVSQNGTASYGGALLFETPDLSAPATTLLGIGVGSYGTKRTFAEYRSGPEAGLGVYLRGAVGRTDGYRNRSGNDSESLFYKFGGTDPSDEWTVSGFVGHQENELAYLGATEAELQQSRRSNGNSEEDDEFLQTLTQIQNVRSFSDGSKLTSAVYYNHLQGNYDFDLNNFLGFDSTDELFNYRFRSHFVGAFSNYQMNFGLGTVTVGGNLNWYERRHTGSERALGDLYENTGRKGEGSIFTKGEYLWGDLLLFSDLQLRHTFFDYNGQVPLRTLDWTFFNPKVGVTYLLTNQTNLYYSVGQTQREPTRNDLFLGNDDLARDESGAALLGPTQAERVVDHEVGVRSKGEGWEVGVNGFFMDFDKELVLNGKLGPNGLPLTASVDRSYRTGVELQSHYTILPALQGGTNLTYLYSKITEGGESFEPVMSPTWIFNQSVEKSWEQLSLRADLRYQSSSYIDFGNVNQIGGFTTVDLAAIYRWPTLELGVHLNNIFSERYFSNGYLDVNGEGRYFAQAPANLFVSLTWKL